VDKLGDFPTANKRIVFLSIIAIGIGAVGALVAAALLYLIGFFTNLFYFGRIGFTFVSPSANQLGDLAIVILVLGGLVVGLMARYGSERIRGHGIPEALEAILINKSKIESKVTVLKPLSTAISIGSGGPFGAKGRPRATFRGDFAARQVLAEREDADEKYYPCFDVLRKFLVPIWLERVVGKRLAFPLNTAWAKYCQK